MTAALLCMVQSRARKPLYMYSVSTPVLPVCTLPGPDVLGIDVHPTCLQCDVSNSISIWHARSYREYVRDSFQQIVLCTLHPTRIKRDINLMNRWPRTGDRVSLFGQGATSTSTSIPTSLHLSVNTLCGMQATSKLDMWWCMVSNKLIRYRDDQRTWFDQEIDFILQGPRLCCWRCRTSPRSLPVLFLTGQPLMKSRGTCSDSLMTFLWVDRESAPVLVPLRVVRAKSLISAGTAVCVLFRTEICDSGGCLILWSFDTKSRGKENKKQDVTHYSNPSETWPCGLSIHQPGLTVDSSKASTLWRSTLLRSTTTYYQM